ncbi:hypothetical protein KR067_005859, partial [Drosophila pandora]
IKKLHETSTRKRVEYAETMIRIRNSHQAMQTALDRAKEELPDYQEWRLGWKERKAAVVKSRINVKNMHVYKNIKQAIEVASNLNNPRTSTGSEKDTYASTNADNDDDDIQIQGNSDVFSIYDPWSKAVMMNPVRNMKCSHVYDRQSVLKIIKENIGIRCPVLGCGNESYLHPNILVEDEETRQRVLRKLAEEEKEAEENEVE